MTTETTERSKENMLASLREAIKAIEDGRDHAQILVLDDGKFTKTNFFKKNTSPADVLYGLDRLKFQVIQHGLEETGGQP